MVEHEDEQPRDDEPVTADELREAWHVLSPEDRSGGLKLLPRADAEDLYLGLSALEQYEFVVTLPPAERRSWVRLQPPDHAADLVQAAPAEEREALLGLLDAPTRKDVQALLAYAEDDAGGLMNPRYARLRPDMTVDEAITYLRKQARERLETIYYAYVLEQDQRLVGVVSLRDLFMAQPAKTVREVMQRDPVVATESMDQEALSHLFSEAQLVAVPVVDERGVMKGIVTIDDIVDVVEEEATEDIQKLGGMEALERPYLQIGFGAMIKKRAGWLAALLLGEMLTATAMGQFEGAIARAVVLAVFVPLIISSGGNSGSQATTLVIRAMALGEVTLGDWWRVVRREFAAGLGLGIILAVIGAARIVTWQAMFHTYGEHYLRIAIVVGTSLMGVVLWGTLVGSSLPFLLRRIGFDPASASAPFVATLVDVFGIVIYFTMASLVMGGVVM